MTPIFGAAKKFGPWDGEKWNSYYAWAKIPQLTEVVSLDTMLCNCLITEINEDFQLNYFLHLDYLLKKVARMTHRNILGLYRNPAAHINIPPAPADFVFLGYDLIEEQTQISALTNCGGFPESFSNEELNEFGLITDFGRTREIQR